MGPYASALASALAAYCSSYATAGWAYMKELVKYPPQFKIGALNNNPPIYDLLPKVKGAIEKLQEDREEKYPRQQ